MKTFFKTTSLPGIFVSPSGRYGGLAAVLVLAIPTGLVALLQGAGELRLPYNLFVVDMRLPGIFRLHMLASGLSLLLIPLALVLAHYRHPGHRVVGRLAAVAVVLGALTSLPVAVASQSALLARMGFFAQGVTWLMLLVAGVRAIRGHKVHDHARYMMSMAAVSSGAIWVRMTTTAATAWQLPFDPLYCAAAWAGWLVPLLLVWTLTARDQVRLAGRSVIV